MAEVHGKVDGYSFQGNWHPASADRLTWTAIVRDAEGDVCGSTSGRILIGTKDERACAEAVMQTVMISISDGLGVQR